MNIDCHCCYCSWLERLSLTGFINPVGISMFLDFSYYKCKTIEMVNQQLQLINYSEPNTINQSPITGPFKYETIT